MRKHRVTSIVLAAAVAALAWALPATARGDATTVAVTAGKPFDLKFTLKPTSVKAGAVTFKVVNRGTSDHDFSIAGKKTPRLKPGRTATITAKLKRGKYLFLCTVSGHAAAGMKGTLVVK